MYPNWLVIPLFFIFTYCIINLFMLLQSHKGHWNSSYNILSNWRVISFTVFLNICCWQFFLLYITLQWVLPRNSIFFWNISLRCIPSSVFSEIKVHEYFYGIEMCHQIALQWDHNIYPAAPWLTSLPEPATSMFNLLDFSTIRFYFKILFLTFLCYEERLWCEECLS